MPRFAAAWFTFVSALLALALQPSVLVRGRDCGEAGADDRARGLGRAAHDGGGPADDRADQTALKRQAARGDHNDLG
jgi:hypothetical protein